MKKETIKCKCCDREISEEPCKLAAYTAVVNGKNITVCCQTCANEYKQEQTKSK